MDYISEFDIRLEKEMYYAGEELRGNVILQTIENFKLKGNSRGIGCLNSSRRLLIYVHIFD